MKKPLTEASRRSTFNDSADVTNELVQSSALVRIADALEAGVADYVKMKRDLEFYKLRVKQLSDELDAMGRRNNSLRGVITRLKNDRKNGKR